eukprot:scaffold142154_cov118-Phaeocystis_antarctica.AAC.1
MTRAPRESSGERRKPAGGWRSPWPQCLCRWTWAASCPSAAHHASKAAALHRLHVALSRSPSVRRSAA